MTKQLVTPKKDHIIDLAPLGIIRTETILSRLPIHNLSKKGRVDIKITKKGENGDIELFWDVSYNEKYGQPRQLAYKLDTIVINRKIDELGRPLPKIIRLDSLTQTYRDLGVEPGGRNKTDLRNAFLQNAFAAISAKLQYKAKDGTEKTLEAGFTRYGVIFTGERLPDGRKADAVYLILNEPYWEVLNNAPTRPLDYNYLKELPPTAQRFYEIVSYKIFAAIKYRHPQAKLLYSEYCTFSAQQHYSDYDHFKKQMYKVHKPHLQSGYIKNVRYESTTDDKGKPDWLMCYIPGIKAKAEYKAFNHKHHTDDAVVDEALPRPHELSSTQAENLVRYFYKRFHDREEISPSAKELAQAAELITEHGRDRARFIVDYSMEKAPETNYTPQLFGGILQYASDAVTAFDKREQRRRHEHIAAREEQLNTLYEQYRNQEIERVKSTIPPDEVANLESSIRAELETEGTFPAMINIGIRIRLNACFEERAAILPYEQWREQQSGA